MDGKTMNILVTLDENYIPRLNVMLFTLLRSNPGYSFDVYLLHSGIRESALRSTEEVLGGAGRLIPTEASGLALEDAPTTSRYPKEIYFRIFAARFLPDTLDRVLYLDPDLVVAGSLAELYNMPMENYFFAAASHTGNLLRRMNTLRLDMDEESPYINSGVMLMNLALLRREQNYEDVFDFIERHKSILVLPDQDIISGLYGSRIYSLDPFRYNMTERLFLLHAPFERGLDLDWVRKNSLIIHYCGRNKPWKENYFGELDVFYREAEDLLRAEHPAALG